MLITTKYLKATSKTPARVQAAITKDGKTIKVTVPYDLNVEQQERHKKAAERLLEKMKTSEKIHLIDNRTNFAGYTYQIR